MKAVVKKIGIVGGGPSGMFALKKLLEKVIEGTKPEIHIYEKSSHFGCGMPYSPEGAGPEHVTNVSGNEIPTIVTTVKEWVKTAPYALLERYKINPDRFNDYKVLPRLFFGEYLSGQFRLLLEQAEIMGVEVILHPEAMVTDITDIPEDDKTAITVNGGNPETFDAVIVCSGHSWPQKLEGKVPGCYDSPYPPSKLNFTCNHTVALKGAALTAIDAMRTLARQHGQYSKAGGSLTYTLNAAFPQFNMVMHTRNGLLSAVRFHLEDSHLMGQGLLTEEEINRNMAENNGFLSLDYVFEKDFKDTFKEKEPDFYENIKELSLEDFVDMMMSYRNGTAPFLLLQREYDEAEVSIKLHESVYWKEKLAILSFAMNYPAKHFSAEDMLRLQKVLLPLISIIIAFIPQSSAEEMLALHRAGVLSLREVGYKSHIEPHEDNGIWYYYNGRGGQDRVHYQTFIDCTGQPHLSYNDLPFKSLLTHKTVSQAYLPFRSGREAQKLIDGGSHDVKQMGDAYLLKVPGITINDSFQVVGADGNTNNRIYMMAVPFMSGYNPDYSGLDFCDEASGRIVAALMEKFTASQAELI